MKKIFIFVLLLSLLTLSSCKKDEETKTDETTNSLTVYIWVSSKMEFFTDDEIFAIQKCFKNQNPDVNVVWNLVQNVSKEEFGQKVNTAKDADVILSGNNMDDSDGSNIKIKDSTNTKKVSINSSWCSFEDRYIGIYEKCANLHLQNALKLRSMLTNEKPDLYKKQSVLFIGNSYTFYNDQYKVFRGICENQGMDIDVQTVVKSAANLGTFTDTSSNEYNTIVNKLQTTDFNYIIVQEQSTKPITAYNSFEADLGKLKELIHRYNPNAKIVLFETWAREEGSNFYKENPEYTYKTAEKALLDAYQNAAKKYDLMVSYAGVGFYVSKLRNNKINLYQSDLTHPSGAGTYLAALIHAGIIYGINPRNVSYVPTFKIEASGGNKIQPTAEECEILREVAYDVVYNLDLSIFN